jgi:hypothetical protein
MESKHEINPESVKAMAEATKNFGISAEQFVKAANALAEVIQKAMPLPPMNEIACMRMRLLWISYGPFVIFSGSWWGWLYVLIEFKLIALKAQYHGR